MNRTVFFDAIRANPFGGSLGQSTVSGIEAILDAWDASGLTDLRWEAYILATALSEVGRNMQPVREGFKTTDAEARAYVKSKGYDYAEVINGQVYYGRGLVQLTWFDNYRKMGDILDVDLTGNPDLALRPDIASLIMFEGMTRGTFTGKKLADYFNDEITDWKNARKIVNGLDRADEIAAYGKAFYAALEAAAEPVEPPPLVTDLPPTLSLEARVEVLEAAVQALQEVTVRAGLRTASVKALQDSG